MATSFFTSKVQPPSSAPTITAASGSFSVATARESLSGISAISPIASSVGFPMTLTPQPYGDLDALVSEHIYVSSDGGTTWRRQSSGTIGEVTLNSFDAAGTLVAATDTQTAGVGALDFGTFGPSDSPTQLLYIENLSGSDPLSFLEFSVFDPTSLEIANDFADIVQFTVEGTFTFAPGDGTLNTSQNGSEIWKAPENGPTVLDVNVSQNTIAKIRVSLVNYPVTGFEESTVNLAVDITTTNSLRALPSYFDWKTSAFRYDPERGYEFPFLSASGNDLVIGPAAVNIGGAIALNPTSLTVTGLADGTYRVYVNTLGGYETQLTSENLPLGASEIATFSVSSSVPGSFVYTSTVASTFNSIASDETIVRGRFVQVGNSGRLEYADGTKTAVGVSLEDVASLENLSFAYGDFALVEVDAAYAAGTEIGAGTDGIGTSGESLAVMLTASTAANEYVLVKLLASGGGSGGGGSTNTDETVKVSANDTTAGFLNGKLVAGSGIILTEDNDGTNETLTISAGVQSSPGITGYLDDLVAAWELDADPGITADSSGNGNTLTNVGVTTTVSALFNEGADFGGSQRLTVPTGTDFQPGNSFTIFGWVSDNVDNCFSQWNTSGNNRSWRILSLANGTVQYSTNGSDFPNEIAGFTEAPNANGYYFVALSHNATTNSNTLRINDSTHTWTGVFNNGSADLSIGGRADGSGDYTGTIDQVLYYGTVKSQSFLDEVYNNGDGVDFDDFGGVSAFINGQVLVTDNDTTADYLAGKLVAGNGISIVEDNDGLNETLTINALGDDPTEPVAQYDLEDLTDSSGNGLTLTNNGSVTFGPAKFSNGAEFDGTAKRLSRATVPALEFGDKDWSLSLWCNKDSLATSGFLINKDDTPGADREFLMIVGNTGLIQIILGDGGSTIQVTNTAAGIFSAATDHHIVASYNTASSLLKIYLDGSEVVSETITLTPGVSASDFEIGDRAVSSLPWDGWIDQVVKFDDVLTSSQVAGLYNGGSGNADPVAAINNLATKDVQVSVNDSTPGFLVEKLVEGNGISIVENNDGLNETLTVSYNPLILDSAFTSDVVAGATPTTLVFNDEALDTDSIYNTSNGNITPATTAGYKVSCSVRLATPTVGRHQLILVNDTDTVNEIIDEIYVPVTGIFPSLSFSRTVTLDSAKVYRFEYRDNAGSGTSLRSADSFVQIERA